MKDFFLHDRKARSCRVLVGPHTAHTSPQSAAEILRMRIVVQYQMARFVQRKNKPRIMKFFKLLQ